MVNNNKFWIFFLLICLPLIISYLIFKGEPHYERLDILGPITVEKKTGDTTYHSIPDFTLTDQRGNAFSRQNLKGNIHVANFIFTRCPKECPIMTSNMKQVHDRYRDMDDVKFISFTIDPKHDTPDVLKEYANKYDADYSRWKFLTGDRDKIYDLAKKGYFIAVEDGGEDEKRFLHSDLFILIDKENRIRGIYSGMNERAIMKLKDEILVLQHEYK